MTGPKPFEDIIDAGFEDVLKSAFGTLYVDLAGGMGAADARTKYHAAVRNALLASSHAREVIAELDAQHGSDPN